MRNKIMAAVFASACGSFGPVLADSVDLISVDPLGGPGDVGGGFLTLSSDGRYAAFVSDSTNLVPGDANGFSDLFVRDRLLGVTTRITVGPGGVDSDAPSFCPVIAKDGRYVLFSSLASNLVAGDTNGDFDIFLHDRQSGVNERISISSSGAQANGASFLPTMSADARIITFVSDATNLDSNTPDTNLRDDIYVRDRQAQTTVRISLGLGGAQGNDHSLFPIVSGDGRVVAYTSDASNLVTGDGNGLADVFFHDFAAGTTERISVSSAGVEADAEAIDIGIDLVSGDGRYVAFSSAATNLQPGDTNGFNDVFVRDTVLDTTVRVSTSSTGQEGNGDCLWAAISNDGRYVAFESDATNLVPADTNGVFDVFLRDVANNTTVRVSVDENGLQGDADSFAPTMATDGRHIGINSDATNLVPGDTNLAADSFVIARCWSEFKTFGEGLAGAGGVVPSLQGGNGACSAGYSLGVDDVVGGTVGVMFVGTTELAQAALGGTLYVSLAAPFVTLALPVGGLVGVVGAGAIDLPAVDVNAIAGTSLILQFLAADPAAPAGVSISNALRMLVAD